MEGNNASIIEWNFKRGLFRMFVFHKVQITLTECCFMVVYVQSIFQFPSFLFLSLFPPSFLICSPLSLSFLFQLAFESFHNDKKLVRAYMSKYYIGDIVEEERELPEINKDFLKLRQELIDKVREGGMEKELNKEDNTTYIYSVLGFLQGEAYVLHSSFPPYCGP